MRRAVGFIGYLLVLGSAAGAGVALFAPQIPSQVSSYYAQALKTGSGLVGKYMTISDPKLQYYIVHGYLALGAAFLLALIYAPYGLLAKRIGWLKPRAREAKVGVLGNRKIVRTAQKSLKAGDFAGAGEAFEAAEAYKEAIDAYLKGDLFERAAEVCERANDPDKAIEYYEKGKSIQRAIDLAVKVEKFQLAGEILYRNDSKRLAAEMFERGDMPARSAKVYAEVEEFPKAAAMYRKAGQGVKAAEAYVQAYNEERTAIERIVASREQEERVLGFALSAGELYAEAGRFDKAGEMFEAGKAFDRAAAAYVKGGQPEKAAKAYVTAGDLMKAAEFYQTAGNRQRAAEMIAEIRLKEGKTGQAAEMFEDAGDMVRAGELYEEAGRPGDAARVLAEAGQYQTAADLYLRAGENSKAAEMYALAGDYAQAAERFESAGDAEKAGQYFERAGSFYRAGRILRQAGNPDLAVETLQRAERGHADYREACALLGELFLQQGQPGLARDRLKEATAGEPVSLGNLQPHFHLAVLDEKEGRIAEALALFEKIQAVNLQFPGIAEKIKDARARLKEQGAAAAPPQAVPGPAPVAASARYRLIEEIGRGGMGIVYKAHDTVLNRVVAYKILPEMFRQNPTILQRFMSEARAAAVLNHPNIVTVYDFGQDGEKNFITMEYVEGFTLKQVLASAERLALQKAAKYFYQILRGMEYAHEKRVIHRDLKPSNIMVTKEDRVKIMDFGLAKIVDEATLTDPGRVSGTLIYMSPEQIRGEKVDLRSDVYSLGVIFYELLTNWPPFFSGDIGYQHLNAPVRPPRERFSDVPAAFERIAMKALSKDPASRYGSVAEILADLLKVVKITKT